MNTASPAPSDAPLLSVVMPAYDVERYVPDAVRSVLAQDGPRIELIVVDDGSADGTVAAVQRAAAEAPPGAAVRVVEQANAGASVARSRGLEVATGDFVGFIDADDAWEPGLAAALVGALTADETADLAFPRVAYMGEDGEPLGFTSRLRARRFGFMDLLTDNPINTATGVIVRAEAVRAVGTFDASLRACIDLDYWVRVGRLRPGNIVGVDRVLARYRRRPGQITSDWHRMERGWRAVMDKTRAAHPERVAQAERRAEAHRRVYWATIAYQAGEHADARRLIAQAWRGAPLALLRHEPALVRLGACIASLAPAPAHRRAAVAFGALRHGRRGA